MGAKTLLSLEEFLALPEEEGVRHELDEGELITMPTPAVIHAVVVQRINLILSRYVYEHRLGEVLANVSYLLSRKPAKTVRQPDLSFVSRQRFANAIGSVLFEGAPELAVEVVSPSDSASDLNRKVKQYLAAGAREVWIAYPDTRTVHVHRSSRIEVFKESDTLTSDLFPGWSVKIAEFFDLS